MLASPLCIVHGSELNKSRKMVLGWTTHISRNGSVSEPVPICPELCS